MAVTHETLSLLFQFGGFIVALLGLVVTIVVALTKKSKTAIEPSEALAVLHHSIQNEPPHWGQSIV
ncbi:putative holin-like toxin [Brevibacillus laterosporus]|uniref:Uncharacterized protein n=1 Tax=Brevibacillus laterosporus TaxID=1465 RepID=A0A0F7BYV4_BRELA|nr:hypothetical protein EX87_02515 [Brevibacillus laterosporus]